MSSLSCQVKLAAWRYCSRYAPRFIESQRLGDFSITRIGVAVNIGERLTVGIQDLEAAVNGLNGPWCREASHWQLEGFSAFPFADHVTRQTGRIGRLDRARKEGAPEARKPKDEALTATARSP